MFNLIPKKIWHEQILLWTLFWQTVIIMYVIVDSKCVFSLSVSCSLIRLLSYLRLWTGPSVKMISWWHTIIWRFSTRASLSPGCSPWRNVIVCTWTTSIYRLLLPLKLNWNTQWCNCCVLSIMCKRIFTLFGLNGCYYLLRRLKWHYYRRFIISNGCRN